MITSAMLKVTEIGALQSSLLRKNIIRLPTLISVFLMRDS